MNWARTRAVQSAGSTLGMFAIAPSGIRGNVPKDTITMEKRLKAKLADHKIKEGEILVEKPLLWGAMVLQCTARKKGKIVRVAVPAEALMKYVFLEV